MAEDRKNVTIKEDDFGEIQVAEEVVVIIAGLAATEVEGVSSMAGITNDIVSRIGVKNLAKGVRIQVEEGEVTVFVTVNIAYGYSIPVVSEKVQDKVKTAIETMTGLKVAMVNVRIADVNMKAED